MTTLGTFGPNPHTERGTAGKLDASEDGNWLCYPSAKSVILRDARVPTKCDCYAEHLKEVTVARFSPNGQWVMSGDKVGTVRMWSPSHPEKMLKKETPVLGGGVLDLAWDHESKRVIVGGDGGKSAHAKVFMAETGSSLGEITGAQKPIQCVAMKTTKPSTCATGSQDFKVGLFAGPPYKYLKTAAEHGNFPQCVRYSPDGSLLCSVGSDKAIFLVDATTGDLKFKLPGEVDHAGGSVYGCNFSPDNKKLLTVSGDKTAKLWDLATQKVITTFTMGNNSEDMQVACVWATGGACPISQSLGGNLNFLDVNSGKVQQTVFAHVGHPTSLACDYVSSKDVYISDSLGGVTKYSFAGVGSHLTGKGHENDVFDVVARNGVVATCGLDDTLRFISGTEFKGSCSVGGGPQNVFTNPTNSNHVAFVTAKKAGIAVDGRVACSVDLKFTGSGVAVSPDGKTLVVGNREGKCCEVYTVEGDALKESGKKLPELLTYPNVIAYSPDGKYVAVGDGMKEVSLWDGKTFEPIVRQKWVFHGTVINALAFSPDSQYLASASNDCHVYLWNPASHMKKTKILFAHKNGVTGLDWASNTEIVTCGGDMCVRKFTPELPKA